MWKTNSSLTNSRRYMQQNGGSGRIRADQSCKKQLDVVTVSAVLVNGDTTEVNGSWKRASWLGFFHTGVFCANFLTGIFHIWVYTLDRGFWVRTLNGKFYFYALDWGFTSKLLTWVILLTLDWCFTSKLWTWVLLLTLDCGFTSNCWLWLYF